jgi:hypothetical protein
MLDVVTPSVGSRAAVPDVDPVRDPYAAMLTSRSGADASGLTDPFPSPPRYPTSNLGFAA